MNGSPCQIHPLPPACHGPGWVAFRDRLPAQGQAIEMWDRMFDRVDGPIVVWWQPEHTDGDYTAWRPVE